MPVMSTMTVTKIEGIMVYSGCEDGLLTVLF